jgi:hypothetical protein
MRSCVIALALILFASSAVAGMLNRAARSSETPNCAAVEAEGRLDCTAPSDRTIEASPSPAPCYDSNRPSEPCRSGPPK